MSLNDLKEMTLKAALGTGAKTTVILDATKPRVGVPQHLLRETKLALDLGYNLPTPTDIDFDDTGFSVTLSFNRTPTACFIPWASLITVLSPGVTGSWEVPEESDEPQPAAEPARGGLKLVK